MSDSFGDVDFAWHSRPGAARIIDYLWKDIDCEKRGETSGRRWHPTQKLLAVMRWSIEQAWVAAGGLVIDPYAGSGSTGVACVQSGRRCVLIEKDDRYIDPIIRRPTEAIQPLFAATAPAVQY